GREVIGGETLEADDRLVAEFPDDVAGCKQIVFREEQVEVVLCADREVGDELRPVSEALEHQMREAGLVESQCQAAVKVEQSAKALAVGGGVVLEPCANARRETVDGEQAKRELVAIAPGERMAPLFVAQREQAFESRIGEAERFKYG